MTRKDFELIAATIRTSKLDPDARQTIAAAFAVTLPETNPRFRPDVFLAACGTVDTSQVERDLGLA